MAYWVAKARPRRAPGPGDLTRGGRDTWDTTRPARAAAAGDRLFFYAGSPASRVTGLGTLARWRRLAPDGQESLFDVRYLSDWLPAGPRLAELRADPLLGAATFVKSGPSATLYPLTDDQGARLFELTAAREPAVAAVWPDLAAPNTAVPALPDVDADARALSGREGREQLVTHLRYERDRRLVAAKRDQVLASGRPLACEVCGFDFGAAYGRLGEDFCEVHHNRPLGGGERRTKLDDLAVVCSNCHRMLHRRRPVLSVAQLRRVVGGVRRA